VAAIEEHPSASLRSVAMSVGVSPETVRSVRLSLAQGAGQRSDLPSAAPAAEVLAAAKVAAVEVPAVDVLAEHVVEAPTSQATATDARANTASEGFGVWFARTGVDASDCARWVGAVPAGGLAEVVREARRRSRQWSDFADALESRTAGRPEAPAARWVARH